MKTRFALLFALFITVAVTAGAVSPRSVANPEITSVDGRLFEDPSPSLTVKVTANSAETAVRAVEAIGGDVVSSSEQGTAVFAVIPAAQLDALIVHPGVRAVESAAS
jgi:hypothetical protein